MQKQISKQSLAIVALSIILAISMAITATFAAFTAEGTVSGTITFTNGDLSITVTGTSMQDPESGVRVTVQSDGTSSNAIVEVRFTDDAFYFPDYGTNFELSYDARDILAGYTFTISSAGSKTYYWAITADNGYGSLITLGDGASGYMAADAQGETADAVLTLGYGYDSDDSVLSIIDNIIMSDSQTSLTGSGFTLSISASYADIRP